MPVYDYQCRQCSRVFANEFRRYEERESGPECCGQASGVVWLTAPQVHGAVAFQAFQSPCDGRIIRTQAEYKEDLRRNNCVPYEPGIRQDQDRRTKREERETSQLVDKIVAQTAQQLTT